MKCSEIREAVSQGKFWKSEAPAPGAHQSTKVDQQRKKEKEGSSRRRSHHRRKERGSRRASRSRERSSPVGHRHRSPHRDRREPPRSSIVVPERKPKQASHRSRELPTLLLPERKPKEVFESTRELPKPVQPEKKPERELKEDFGDPREIFKTPNAPKREREPTSGEWKRLKAEVSVPALISPLPPTPAAGGGQATRSAETGRESKPPRAPHFPPRVPRGPVREGEVTPPRRPGQAPKAPAPASPEESTRRLPHTPPRFVPGQGESGRETVYPPALERRSPWSRALFRAHYLALRLAIEWGYRPRPPTWPRFAAAELRRPSNNFRAVLEAFRRITYPPQGEEDLWHPPATPDSTNQ
ncbi:serine/arginine repetitive matrix protein 1-like [Phlebotomus papatasi]|uniref:serine/arginine repetitive matrix protein 1-like n=1 Tax=Phlebotomus papatasi TaxID=29031 RepID=UPI0024840DA7|nr:serine/arginine repetitive matrix protein 1-like [Phlebotomus papatasi]